MTRPGEQRSAEIEAEDDELEEAPGLLGLGITIIAVLFVGVIVLLVDPLREAVEFALKGDTEALREELDGAAGIVMTLVLAALHSVVFYPAEILDAAAGFVFGFWAGLGLVMVGWALNAYIAWEIGRHGARPVLYRLIGRARFRQMEGMIERGGVFLLLSVRVIPIVPYSLFTIVAGAAGVPLFRLMWTSVIGYIPLTALFVYLGTQLEELSPTNPILIGGAIALVVVIYAAHKLRPRLLGEHRAD